MALGVTKFWLRSLEAVLLALLLVLALLAWRLSKGPLPLDPLAPYIENALNYSQPGVRLKIGGASVQWQQLARRPVLTVQNVQATDARGVIASFPRMEVELALVPLLRGAIVPEQVVLSNPIVRLARRADGSFAFGLAPSDEVEPTDNGLMGTALIDALTQPAGEDNSGGYLRRVAITHSMLVILDQVTNRRWLIPDASLNLERAGPDVKLSFNLPVIDNERPWTVKATGRFVAATRKMDVAFELDGFHPAGIAELAPQLHPLRAADLGLSGKVDVKLALERDAVRLEQIAFDVKGSSGRLNMPSPLNRAYPIKQAAVKGTIEGALDQIVLQQLHLDLEESDDGGATISMTGQGKDLNTAPDIVLDIGLGDLSLAALKHYWPAGVKPNTFRWISENLNGGSLSESTFHVALGGPRLEELALRALDGKSILSGIDVTYMKRMPKVEKTEAVLKLTPKEVVIEFSDGHVPDAQTGKGVRVRGGAVRLTELGGKQEMARVGLDLAGDFGEVMRIIDHEPLKYADAMGIDPTAVTGAAQVDLDISFPLIAALKLSQIQIAVKAKVSGAHVPSVALEQPLTDSDLAMTLDGKGMDVRGTVSVAGVPASLVWRENFGGGAFRSRYEIETVLGNEQRPLFALTAPIFTAPYLSGPVKTKLVYTRGRDGVGTIESEADLRDAEVAIRELGWIKAPGAPATAKATTTVTRQRLSAVQDFELVSGDDVALAGSAAFNGDSQLSSLKITRARVGETDLTGEIARDETGRYTIDVRGAAFNSTYFWKELGRDDARGSGGSQAKTPMTIRANFDRMWLAKEGDFRDVRLTYSQGRAGIEEIDFFTQVDGTAPFTFNLNSQDGKRVFHGESAAGGEVVRAVGLFDDIVGGDLKIDGEIAADGAVSGRADINNLKLVEAPLLARLLSVAALTGIVDELSGKGISFQQLRVPFTYANSTLHVTDAEMKGTSLGLTGKGNYSFAASQMDFEGTIIPAYRLNNLLGSIPLIGTLLTGGEKGGGVLAATYSYRGNPASAQPSVNPLAALAPGFTRRIFDIFKSRPPQSAATPAKPPAKSATKPEDPS